MTVKGDDHPELDETFHLVLSNPSANVPLIGSTATGTIINDDGLSVAAAAVTETSATDTQLVFTVTLSHASEEAVTVAYATTDGTAKVADNDYVATSGTLTFAPGRTTALVTVTVKGDANVELDETFNLVLSNPSANTKLVSSTAIWYDHQ